MKEGKLLGKLEELKKKDEAIVSDLQQMVALVESIRPALYQVDVRTQGIIKLLFELKPEWKDGKYLNGVFEKIHGELQEQIKTDMELKQTNEKIQNQLTQAEEQSKNLSEIKMIPPESTKSVSSKGLQPVENILTE